MSALHTKKGSECNMERLQCLKRSIITVSRQYQELALQNSLINILEIDRIPTQR